MTLTLSIDNVGIIKWWVDASYNVHPDCKGHTGEMMSFGSGAAISSAKKQNINSDSSTIAELIGLHDTLPNIMWTKYFFNIKIVRYVSC